MPRPADNTSRSLYSRRSSIDRELGFSVENDEHLFDGVVEVVANPGSRRNLAAMQEIELGRNSASVEKGRERHRTCAAMHGGRWAVRGRIRMDDSPSRRVLRNLRHRRQKKSHC
jgi:hypothetical protein